LEVVSGIILGLDSDTFETETRLKEFIDASQVPMLTMNLLQALPNTALWTRLQREERLTDDPSLESNVRFLRPYADVVETWRRCIDYAYRPERLFARFMHQIEATYVNRFAAPARGRLTRANMKRGAILMFNLMIRLGLLAQYRRPFWQMVRRALKRGQIEALFGIGFVAYHLIEFSREAVRGDQNASFYSARSRESLRSTDTVTPCSIGNHDRSGIHQSTPRTSQPV
jgi:hypothetical protein